MARKTEKATEGKGGKKSRKPTVTTEMPTREKKPSALEAAAKVLGEAGEPMNCQAMIEAMAKKGYGTSPGGATPAATLYAAIAKEVKTKGKESRFKKTERGKFALA
jgi:HB1, ASXL, restriction endonuclease HTH domain